MFETISMLGKVEMDKVLFRFEGEPIIFVCKNKSNTRFLCVNTGYGIDPTWLIAKSSLKTLIKMMRDEISILDAFAESKSSIFIVHQEDNKMIYNRLPFNEIEASELPDAKEKLQNPNLSQYIQELENEQIKKNYRSMYHIPIHYSLVEQHGHELGKFSRKKRIKELKGIIEYVEG